MAFFASHQLGPGCMDTSTLWCHGDTQVSIRERVPFNKSQFDWRNAPSASLHRLKGPESELVHHVMWEHVQMNLSPPLPVRLLVRWDTDMDLVVCE